MKFSEKKCFARRVIQPLSAFSLAITACIAAMPSFASCTYTVTSQSTNAFTADIKMTNAQAVPTSGWGVTWSYVGKDRVTTAANVTLVGSNPYTANNSNLNAVIQPGQTYTFAIQGTKGELSAGVPAVTGAICNPTAAEIVQQELNGIYNPDVTTDSEDAAPGDKRCLDSAGKCSLRAAATEVYLRGNGSINLKDGTEYNLTINKPITLRGTANLRAGYDNLGNKLSIAKPATIKRIGFNSGGILRAEKGLSTNRVVLDSINLTGGVDNNATSGYGAGLNIQKGTVVTARNIRVYGNKVAQGSGAGIYNAGRLYLSDSDVSENTNVVGVQNANGGGIYNVGILVLDRVSIVKNSAFRGAGIFSTTYYNSSRSWATLTGVTIANNIADVEGSAVFSLFGDLDITESSIVNNTVTKINERLYKSDAVVIYGGDDFSGDTSHTPNALAGKNRLESVSCSSGSCHSKQANGSYLYIDPSIFSKNTLASMIVYNMGVNGCTLDCALDVAEYLKNTPVPDFHASGLTSNVLAAPTEVYIQASIIAKNMSSTGLANSTNIAFPYGHLSFGSGYNFWGSLLDTNINLLQNSTNDLRLTSEEENAFRFSLWALTPANAAVDVSLRRLADTNQRVALPLGSGSWMNYVPAAAIPYDRLSGDQNPRRIGNTAVDNFTDVGAFESGNY